MDFISSGTGVPLVQSLQDNDEFLRATPVVDFEYVDVTFDGADTDKDIRTRLRPANPDNIDYYITRKDRACDVYHDQSGTRKAWGTGYVILRCSAASATVRLLLLVRRT